MKLKDIQIWFKQLICKHTYQPVPDIETDKFIKDSERLLMEGKISSYSYSQQYKCSKCPKEKLIGSDLMI